MEDLRTYLALSPNEQLYSEGLQLFRQYAMASHAQYYTKLAPGPFVGNREKLLLCLREASALPHQPAPKPTVVTIEAPKAAPRVPTNQKEFELAIQLRKLRHQRKQSSQQFHGCDPTTTGDAERALICDRIDAINIEIKTAAAKLTYLQQYGHLPKEVEEQAKPLPDTIEACKKERSLLSSNILKVENRIAFLLTLPPNSSKRRKQLPGKNEQLQQLVSRRTSIRIKIKQLENDATA